MGSSTSQLALRGWEPCAPASARSDDAKARAVPASPLDSAASPRAASSPAAALELGALQTPGRPAAAFPAYFSRYCLARYDLAAVGALLSQVVTGVAWLLLHGPAVCLPKALAYLCLGALNLGLLAWPAPAAARVRLRPAAAAALRVAYLLPALLLGSACRLGPGGALGGAACTAQGAGSMGKALVKLLVYDTGAVFALWYGLMLPLPFELHLPVQIFQWLMAASGPARAVCAASRPQPCAAEEAAAFGRMHGAWRALVGLAAGHTFGGPAPLVVAARAPAVAPRAASAAQADCHVVSQLVVFYWGLVAPLACGYAFDRALRRKHRAEAAAGAHAAAGAAAAGLVFASRAAGGGGGTHPGSGGDGDGMRKSASMAAGRCGLKQASTPAAAWVFAAITGLVWPFVAATFASKYI